MRRRRGEEGQLSVFVAVLVLPLVLVVGLVADGGGVLAAHQRAIDTAFEAARAGAQQLDQDVLRSTGAVTLDPPAARSAALAYLAALGRQGTVEVRGDEITVTVSVSNPLAVLSAVGVGPITVRGTATVTATQGITGTVP